MFQHFAQDIELGVSPHSLVLLLVKRPFQLQVGACKCLIQCFCLEVETLDFRLVFPVKFQIMALGCVRQRFMSKSIVKLATQMLVIPWLNERFMDQVLAVIIVSDVLPFDSTRQDNADHVGMHFHGPVQQLDSGHAGQCQAGHHDVDFMLCEYLQRFLCAECSHDLIIVRMQ